MYSGLSCISILGASEGLFEGTSTVGGLENENEKVRSNYVLPT
jgi:hypothetical protein